MSPSRRQPTLDEIDREIARIQASTKTASRLMLPAHDWLRLHWRFYYSWHLYRAHRIVQWLALALITLVEIGLVLSLAIGLATVVLLVFFEEARQTLPTILAALIEAFTRR